MLGEGTGVALAASVGTLGDDANSKAMPAALGENPMGWLRHLYGGANLGMRKFKVYKHSTQRVEIVEAVKVGFSWPAFFFSFWWMFAKGLWIRALIWIVASIPL